LKNNEISDKPQKMNKSTTKGDCPLPLSSNSPLVKLRSPKPGPLLERREGDLRGQSPFVVRNAFWIVGLKAQQPSQPQRGSPNIYVIPAERLTNPKETTSVSGPQKILTQLG
jgi:hypothetical protein